MMLQLLVSCAGKELQKIFEWRLGDAELISSVLSRRQMRALNKGGVRV